jgi:phenylacetate-CoA ligase
MNVTGLSDLMFLVGRRYPAFPLALLRRLPLAFLQAMRGPGFRDVLRCAMRSDYYRDAFARAGVDPARARRPEDLGDFFLPARVLKTCPERLLCGAPELAIESSGTSGHVTRIYLSRRELEYSARQGTLLYSVYGLGAADRLLCTLDLAWGLGALLVQRGISYTSAFAMVPGRVDPAEAYRRLPEYGFNVIVSDPFWLVRLTAIARERGRPAALKLMIGGGEGVTYRTRVELEGFWKAPLCMTYASTEAATILGFECAERRGYHVDEFDFFVEIDAPDGDGYGEVVLTAVNRRIMPLIRYRTGDVARWLPEPCPCGLPFRRLSPLRGRLDEQVSCAWGNVHPEFFEPLLAEVRGLGADWQVALYERESVPTFQFRLEVAADGTRADEAMESVLAALRRLYPDAWMAYVQRLVDMEFCFLEPGTLRSRPKLLRLVDERRAGPAAWIRAGSPAVRPTSIYR